MLTLNRKSAVYQKLFTEAMIRINRVPEGPFEYPKFPEPTRLSALIPYVFERTELELQVPQPTRHFGDRVETTCTFQDFFTSRATESQAVNYGHSNFNYMTVPLEVGFGAQVLASLLWLVFKNPNTTTIPFHLQSAAHHAVIRYALGLINDDHVSKELGFPKTKRSTSFTLRTNQVANQQELATFLNCEDVSVIERAVAAYGGGDTGKPEGAWRNRCMYVRFPVQSSQPFTRESVPFHDFPFSFHDYYLASRHVIDDYIFSSFGREDLGEALGKFDDPEKALAQFRVECFNDWLSADEVGPVRTVERVKELILPYADYFCAVYHNDNKEILEFELKA